MKNLFPLFFLVAVIGLSSGQANDDFLFIIMDDQSAARYWSSVRPNPTAAIERMARDGTIFSRAYCPASVCNASRTALLTCKPPNLTGIFRNGNNPRSLPTVLHHLRSHGYRLRAAGKIFHTGYERNAVFSRVFDPRRKGGARIELKKRGANLPLRIGVSREKAGKDTAALKADWMIQSIRKSKPEQKNGFLVGFSATHLPFFVPNSRRYSKAYHQRKVRLPVSTWLRIPEFSPVLDRKYRLSPRKRREVISRYYGCLRYDSDEAAKVIRIFRSKYPGGHVVFLSDHGFLLDEGRAWGKSSTMELACHVPYIVWSKKLAPGAVQGPISTGTAFPLLLDLCGVPEYPGAHWQSPRRSVTRGRTPDGHIVYTYAGTEDWVRATRGETVHHFKNGAEYITGLDDQPLD